MVTLITPMAIAEPRCERLHQPSSLQPLWCFNANAPPFGGSCMLRPKAFASSGSPHRALRGCAESGSLYMIRQFCISY